MRVPIEILVLLCIVVGIFPQWSIGPALALNLFDGGARTAQKESAIAAYDKTVASYRQTVLTAFQEVEDNLAALRHLAEEASIQQEAVRAR